LAVEISDGPILTMADGQRTERVLFDGDVAMENWPDFAGTEPTDSCDDSWKGAFDATVLGAAGGLSLPLFP
jgi:hypothetical protein